MNTIRPTVGNIDQRKLKKYNSSTLSQHSSPSFKGADKAVLSLITQVDDPIFKIFEKNYGKIGDRIGKKVARLVTENKPGQRILKASSRFSLEKGVSSIKEKKFLSSFLENLIFPFVTLPLYGVSWGLDKVKSIKVPQNASAGAKNVLDKIKSKAKDGYGSALLRVPRKLNELNEKTDILVGIKGKTEEVVKKFAKEKGISFDDAVNLLNSADDTPLAKEASEYVRESLYKVSNKFFDKHTGNFNTAYERPLNRLVTGLIPVGFLAADAYNLSVLCGDKKEVSEKEAKERTAQEISRVFTTAFIQLLTLGSCTKLANTKAWFTPATSAATVLVSETTSRKRIGKPVFFLTKEKAKEYNRKQAEKNGKKGKVEKKSQSQQPMVQASQPIKEGSKYGNLYTPIGNEPAVFTSFKANQQSTKKPEVDQKKDEPKRALINMETFKKGAAILIAGGFVVSFLKNSSYVQNTKVMKGLHKISDFFKKQYNKIAFKDFEISTAEYNSLIDTLKKVNCAEIAEGHNLIRNKYGSDITANATIKMVKHSLSEKGAKDAIRQTMLKLRETSVSLTEDEMKLVGESLGTAIKHSKTSIAEHKYGDVAKKALEIINNRRTINKINIPDEKMQEFAETLISSFTKTIGEKATPSYVQVETKAKPFLDIVIQPFKFVLSAAALPFEKIVKPVCNLITSPITKKAAKAELGQIELTKTQETINKVVKEIFGEKKAKDGKISQTIFANAMEQLQLQTLPYRKAQAELQKVKHFSPNNAEAIKFAEKSVEEAKKKLQRYVTDAVEKSFNGVTQSSNKNTDIAMMTKLASSAVTSAFLVADNYNMVMIKSDGEDKEGAKEKAYERIIQRLSALFYQSMLINWFNSTFRATYNSSLKGMVAVAAPNTLTTEILTRKSIGMPITKQTYEQLYENEKKNESRTGFVGEYFKFMRLLTGKKPLKDRMPKDKQISTRKNFEENVQPKVQSTTAKIEKQNSTNILEKLSK